MNMLAEIDELVVRQPRRAELQRTYDRVRRDVANREFAEDEDPRETPEPVSPERLQIANAGILHLSPIVRQLVELWNGPPSDNYGCLKPTRYAFDRVISLLVDVAIDASPRGGVPLGCVSTDSEGGVRIEWVRDAVSVHLVVPAADSNEAYVYHEIGSNYATEDATPERLSHWLETIPEGR